MFKNSQKNILHFEAEGLLFLEEIVQLHLFVPFWVQIVFYLLRPANLHKLAPAPLFLHHTNGVRLGQFVPVGQSPKGILEENPTRLGRGLPLIIVYFLEKLREQSRYFFPSM